MTIPRLSYRRLEVVVLSARGLGDFYESESDECRRLVELTIVSHLDPEGEEFGTKASPWTLPSEKTGGLRFGRSGLRSVFPLSGPNAPESVDSKRFLESAELRVRLMVSGVCGSSPSMVLAQSLLPAGLVTGVAKELDRATAQVEAETRISLADILDEKADSTQSGWVNLQRRIMTGDALDSESPQLWIQVYVLPDHESHVPSLNVDYEAEGAMLPGFRPAPCRSVANIRAEADEGLQKPTLRVPPGAPGAPQANEQLKAIVPENVAPGQPFTVMVPRVHTVICPPGLAAEDHWQVLSPSTGQMLNVQVPAGVQPGQPFQVQEDQAFQVVCPPNCGPGSTVRVNPPAAGAPGAGPAQAMQVQCPENMRPGDSLHVEVPGSVNALLVEIPPGVAPGQCFAVQLPQTAEAPLAAVPTQPHPDAVMGQAPTQAYPGAAPGQAAPPVAPPTDLLDAPIDLQGDAPVALPVTAEPQAATADLPVIEFPPEPSAEADAATDAKVDLDLAALYASSATEQQASPPAKAKAVAKFEPLMSIDNDLKAADPAAGEVETEAQPESVDALLEGALENFEKTKR